jgi:hypothetical protein
VIGDSASRRQLWSPSSAKTAAAGAERRLVAVQRPVVGGATYIDRVAKWADRLRHLDNRVVGPVRMTDTEDDWYSGNWMYLVDGRALALTLLLLFGTVGGVIGLLAVLGVAPNRLVALLVALVIGPVIWRRYTRHHYRTNLRHPSE